jgi:hypothetical protein
VKIAAAVLFALGIGLCLLGVVFLSFGGPCPGRCGPRANDFALGIGVVSILASGVFWSARRGQPASRLLLFAGGMGAIMFLAASTVVVLTLVR